MEGKTFRFDKIVEGQFHYGNLNGFGRILDSQGECQVGYWKTDNGINVPDHTWAWYISKGQYQNVGNQHYYIAKKNPKKPTHINVQSSCMGNHGEGKKKSKKISTLDIDI